MKFFTILLCTLATLLGSHHLHASVDFHSIQDQIEFSWRGDNSNLYLYIQLPEELVFDQNYVSSKLENGQGCLISCKPYKGSVITDHEDFNLQKSDIYVILENGNNFDKVEYYIVMKNTFEKIESGFFTNTIRSKTFDSEISGTVTTSHISSSRDPIFAYDGLHHGRITFPNKR